MEERQRFDLGLELAMRHARYGAPMPQWKIAAFCGVTDGAIQAMEKRVMRKVRRWHAVKLSRELR